MINSSRSALSDGTERVKSTVDSAHFRRVLGHFPTGVVIVTAIDKDGQPGGLSVGSFTSVSLDPPLVAFLPAKSSTSWPKLEGAGRFCINVLAAEQEAVCRQFARSGADKFRGVGWRPAASGAPIIDSSLAWIDCDLERIGDAGDHLIVLGRVRALDARPAAVPLIFFQGGYGRLDAGPLVAGERDADLGPSLRVVDRVRGEMEDLGATLDAECVASALVGDEVVILASAGPLSHRTSGGLVGQRVFAVPPVGALWMAWESPARVETWLSAVSDAQERDEVLARLERIRGKGYGLSVEGLSLADWETMLVGASERDPRRRAEVHARARRFYEPPDLDSHEVERVRTVHAPVFDDAGRVAIQLNVSGFAARLPADLDRVVASTREAAASMTRLIGGRSPKSGAEAA